MSRRIGICLFYLYTLCALSIISGGWSPLLAQGVESGLIPDTIRVGDPFHAEVRVELPMGSHLEAPDSLAVSGDIENAGRMLRTENEYDDGSREVVLTYPLTAWRTGVLELPTLSLSIIERGETRREVEAILPNLLVLSILPIDTAGVDPQPPKDVLGPSRLLWPWIVGALTLAAAIAALVHLRRGRSAHLPGLTFDVAQTTSPKERALSTLDQIRTDGSLEAGELKVFYTRTFEVLREFIEEYDMAWGTELTSTELLASTGDNFPVEARESLERLLVTADQVKFNRRRPPTEAALQDWQEVRHWVKSFEPVRPDQGEEDPS